MDLQDGYMARNLPEKTGFLLYSEPEKLPIDSIVIIQSCPPWRIPYIQNFPGDATIFFWNLHPNNFCPDLIGSGSKFITLKGILNIFSFIRKKKLKQLLCQLLNTKSIKFMDQENLRSTFGFFDIRNSNGEYLQILTDDKLSNTKKENPVGKNIQCAWIGRIEDFKYPILSHLISRLAELKKINITFTIVGNGKSLNRIKKEVSSIHNIKFKFKKGISYKRLDKLLNEIDILFAMGTSALEGAKNKVPTILLDYTYEKINRLYKFDLIYNRENYNLAELINESHFESESSLESLLNDIVNNYDEHSEKCYQHWENNFSPKFVLPKFLHSIEEASFTIKDLINGNFHKPSIFTILVEKVKYLIKTGKKDNGWIYS